MLFPDGDGLGVVSAVVISALPALSLREDPLSGQYRGGCSQSSFGWNTGPLMKELEKVPKELKGSATL